uniref:Uncharacterized protein n=1 Tax=Lutzomyia longipalpis TaxID=7200 RepID=A0A7G3B3K9_LUTLO
MSSLSLRKLNSFCHIILLQHILILFTLSSETVSARNEKGRPQKYQLQNMNYFFLDILCKKLFLWAVITFRRHKDARNICYKLSRI